MPESDWEFDDTQKLSYNNPIFLDQIKRKGLKIEDLDKGWVVQKKIDEKDDEEYEDEFDDDDDEDDIEEDFSKNNSLENHKKNNRRPIHQRPIHQETSEEDEEIFTVKTKKSKESESKPTAEQIIKPSVSLEDLESMFGTSTPNRDKVENALNEIKAPTSKIKLNVDKTSSEKQTIKLNIKTKN